MSLKRKIRIPNLSKSTNELAVEVAQEDAAKSVSSDDPFTFPGTGSGSSSITSEGQNPGKVPRLVLKLGSAIKNRSAEAESSSNLSLHSPSPGLLGSSTNDSVASSPASSRKEKKARGNKRDKSGRKAKRKKKQEEEVSVNDLYQNIDKRTSSPVKSDSASTSSTALPFFDAPVPLVPVAPSPAVPSAIRSPVQKPAEPFEQLLEYYLVYLERKDDKKFFGFPITDIIAPNYSLLVKHPMDFSTMRKKLARGWYENLPQFKNDFELICSNAMTYNMPDTIYYRAAKKLSRIGQKLMSKERIQYAKRSVQGIDSIPQEILCFDAPPAVVTSRQLPQSLLAAQQGPSTSSGETEIIAAAPLPEDIVDIKEPMTSPTMSPSKFKTGSLSGPYENIPQENAEEILEELRRAGRAMADQLATRKPNLIMPKRMPDGSVTLNLLNPDSKSTLTIGALAGPIKVGSDRLPTFDTRLKMDAATVLEKYYKDYGSFSSHAPLYDSKGSIFTKEEVDMLRSAYGSDKGIAYAESLMRWGQQVRHPVVKRSIEKLINDASGGDHSEVVYLLNERIVTRAEEDKNKWLNAAALTGRDDLLPLEGVDRCGTDMMEQLRTLTNEGIDVGFLDSVSPDMMRPGTAAKASGDVESLLTLNGEILHQLYLEQTKRLATAPIVHLGNVPTPSETECSLAEMAVANLSKLIGSTAPKDVVSSFGTRKALNLI
ncbi:bromodomain-containing protein 7-like [Paramacrobiotus metropolitanus]|uniref:bromodomain-containing protein 7-like n=1 Tax=Paramacrobiotus metropolitanus TaxID=2943436 RepID=UPI002445B225|nr:bromodomain-containing protein 7-like [Paramacrobiotus metropolitanus]